MNGACGLKFSLERIINDFLNFKNLGEFQNLDEFWTLAKIWTNFGFGRKFGRILLDLGEIAIV